MKVIKWIWIETQSEIYIVGCMCTLYAPILMVRNTCFFCDNMHRYHEWQTTYNSISFIKAFQNIYHFFCCYYGKERKMNLALNPFCRQTQKLKEKWRVFCLFSSPFWKHARTEIIPRRQVWATHQLWPRASFVFLGCSGYALEWIRTMWSTTMVELRGIFSQECGLTAWGEVDTAACDKVWLVRTL